MSTADPRFTPKQQRFVAEYLVDLNGTRAAIRAGYAKSSAEERARSLLKLPQFAHVAAAIEAGKAAALAEIGVNRERVLRELAHIGLADIRKLYDENGNLRPIDQLDDDAAASIAGIEVEELYEYEGQGKGRQRVNVGRVRKVKRFEKTKALELLGRHLGLWLDPQPPPPEGPGLTVIVQNGVQIDGQRVTSAARVVVNLPTPE